METFYPQTKRGVPPIPWEYGTFYPKKKGGVRPIPWEPFICGHQYFLDLPSNKKEVISTLMP